jgi:hypothetical protein
VAHVPCTVKRTSVRRIARCIRMLIGACLVMATMLFVPTAMAQGGPPVVTDDPGTPGEGKWEVNLAAIYARTHGGRREIAAPDVDINYGWGEHIQLKADIPWVFVEDDNVGDKKNGLGAGNFGVKWRFVDEDEAGVNVSTYPQYTRNIIHSSARRGISSDNSSFFLPIEASKEIGGFGIDAEIGRTFVEREPDEWEAGIVVAHACGSETVECLVEVHHSFAPHFHQTLLNFGARVKIIEPISFLGAVGRDFGGPKDDRRSVLVYAGLQFSR